MVSLLTIPLAFLKHHQYICASFNALTGECLFTFDHYNYLRNMKIHQFTFNDFAENTYVVWDHSSECLIFDPGCNTSEERKQLSSFIETNGLNPVGLINTHCHIDHVLGNEFVARTYNLRLQSHKGEQVVLDSCDMVSKMYGIPYTPSPKIEGFLKEGDRLTFGNSAFDILYTPGHSPASISFYNEEASILIAGDVLFQMSIGRTDLPGGDFDTLANSIQTKFYTLPDDTVVYPGHGPQTTVGYEKNNNPFVKI